MTAPRLVFLIWALALALVVWRFSPPELEPDSSEHFAGQHALETLRLIEERGITHHGQVALFKHRPGAHGIHLR